MGATISVKAQSEAENQHVSSSANPVLPQRKRMPAARRPRSSDAAAAAAPAPAESSNYAILQQTQAKILRCRTRAVAASDVLFMSQRACAQLMFRMPGVNDSDAALLRRMLSNTGKSLAPSDQYCVFIVEGCGVHEDLLACAAVAPKRRDCYRWQRAIDAALAHASVADALPSSPHDAVFAAATSAKNKSNFDKHFRKCLEPVGQHEFNGAQECSREILARFTAISQAFEDAARCAAHDLHHVLQALSTGRALPDPAILESKCITLVASNAQRSRGYAVTASSLFVLWHCSSALAPLGQSSIASSFSSTHLSHHPVPRITRPLPPVSNNPSLLSNDVIFWEGLYKQLCVASECAVEAILCQNHSQDATQLIAPPLATRIERGGFVFLFLQETPIFGVTGKQLGQIFGGKNQVNVVVGFDSISKEEPMYQPFSHLEGSNFSQFTSLCSRTLYANRDSLHGESPPSSPSPKATPASPTGVPLGRNRLDSFSFCPGLVVYSIPELQSEKRKKVSCDNVGALFIQPMWIETPLISVTWTSLGRVLDAASLTLPHPALVKFCVSCDDEECHPSFGAAVSVSCDVLTTGSNIRPRRAAASNTTHVSNSSNNSQSTSQINASSLSESRWSIFSSAAAHATSPSPSEWATNSLKSLCLCLSGVSSCVSAIASSVEACFTKIFDGSEKNSRTPCRCIVNLFGSLSTLRDGHGCTHFSFLPVILKQTSAVSKISLGILYADLICQLSADAIFKSCDNDSQMRFAWQKMYSLFVDESSTHNRVSKRPSDRFAPTESPSSWSGIMDNWWENSVSIFSCVQALNSCKMLSLFQAEFGTSRGNSSCVLETLLYNVWLSVTADDGPKKPPPHLSRAEFYASWIRAMAARTLKLLFLTEPIDELVDEKMKQSPSPCRYQQPLGWFAHFHHKASIQQTAVLLVLGESSCAHEFQRDRIINVATFCHMFCYVRFLLSSKFVSKLLHARSIEDSNLSRANNEMHEDPNPHVIPAEHEPSDDFLPKPVSAFISRQQQRAADLLDVGPSNFNERCQRIPLASTFGSSSWIAPVYISPIPPSSEPSQFDAGHDFINRVQSASPSSFDNQRSSSQENSSNKLSEPQSTLECMRVMHGLALQLLNFAFVFDLQFVLNALADVLITLGIIGSVCFDHKNGTMLPLNRRSSHVCQNMAATLYLRSMASSRLNTGASASMFRLMCNVLSNGQTTFITRNYMPFHIRDFLLNGDVPIEDLEQHPLASVAMTDVLFSKILNTHAVWAVETGFKSNDPVLLHTCKRSETCEAESVRVQSLSTGDGNKPLDWVISALACPMVHTFGTWLSSCNPEANLNDVVVIASSTTVHLLGATAQVLANAYASAIAASVSATTPLDVSCVLFAYASMCCKFFGEWTCIEKNSNTFAEQGNVCPCQMLFGIVACIEPPEKSLAATDDFSLISSSESVEKFECSELSLQEAKEFMLIPCVCDMLALLTHHEHGDKLTSYDPALLCFSVCPSRAFCDVSFKHVGQYCSDSTMLLVESGLRLRKFKKSASEFFRQSGATLMSLNASSCLFVGDESMLNLLRQSSGVSECSASAATIQCLCLDGCLHLTSSFMSKLSSLPCIVGLECLVLPSFEQSSVLMGNFTETMQQKVTSQFATPLSFDDFSKKMRLQPENHDVVDQLGYRSVQIVDPSLKFISECSPNLSDALQALLLTGKREDTYSAHEELMGRYAVATAWCREMRKQACAKEAVLFERNRTQIFAANQWREIDSKTGKSKSESTEDDAAGQETAAIQDGSTNLWASNERIKNVSVMMGRLEKMAAMTAVVRDLSSASSVQQFVGKTEVFDTVVESFKAIQAQQDQSRYVSLSGNLMVRLRQQKKDLYIRQLGTRACIRTALLHHHVRISARLCVVGQGPAKTAALMHVTSEQSAEYCRHMLNLVANSFEGPGCNGETIVELLRRTPNLLHLSFVRAHPFSSSRLIDLLALRMSKTLMRMRQLWMLWDAYKMRLGRMNFQRSIHYERVPVKESIITDHVGFHDRHCIMASKYVPKLVLLDLGGLKHVSDMGRCAFFFNCTNIQAVMGSGVSVTPLTNECLLTLAARMLPPLKVLFSYLTNLANTGIYQIEPPQQFKHSTEAIDDLMNLENLEKARVGMKWSLQEHLSNQNFENMSWKERQAAARAKAEQERKEKLLQQVSFRLQTRRNVLHCKAAITSYQGKTARLRWIKLNELANFNPALRDSLGLSASSVMAPETGSTKFGEPRYDYADVTPSMLASALLRIRFQVLQLSLQCCQTPDRIKRNLLRVKNSNRNYDDPFVAPEEIFGEPNTLKDPCQVFIRVTAEGQPDRSASRVRGLRLSHDKYFTSCTAGPVDIKSMGDCLAPIMMRQTGYLVIPEISSRLMVEIRCQSYSSDAQMVTAIPVKPLLMPHVFDEPRDTKIELKYAPKLEDDDVSLNSGLQQAYYKNKHFILNGGAKMGYIQAEMTVMSPWQADLMVSQSQSRKSDVSIEKTETEPEANPDSEKSQKPSGIKGKRKATGVEFDPNDTQDCVLLAESSLAAHPLKMRLYRKYDRGNVFAGLLLQRDRLLHGDGAVIRCRAPVGLSGLLVDHADSWENFKQKQIQAARAMQARWDNGGLFKKLQRVLTGRHDSEQPTLAIENGQGLKQADDAVVPVSLEGIEGQVDARAYLVENRDQDSDFEDVEEAQEVELVGDGAVDTSQQLMMSSVGTLVEYCVDTVIAQILDEMTFRKPPFGDMRHVRCLELDNSIVTDKFFLDCFDLLIGLRSLSIAGCKRLTSATMLCVAKSQSAPHLQFLDLSRVCDWNSETVAALCSIAKAVLELRMDYDIKPTLTDGCVLLMSQNMKGLRLLSLNGVQSLANESVSGLMDQARNLRSLSIAGLGFMNDLSLQYAYKCSNLVFLSISFAVLVTDEGLRHIARCRQLRTLLMQNLTEVTDDGLVILGSGCGRLQTLDVIGCERLSPRGPDYVVQLCPFLNVVSVDATPAMRAWKRQVEGVGSTSNVRVLLNFAAPT